MPGCGIGRPALAGRSLSRCRHRCRTVGTARRRCPSAVAAGDGPDDASGILTRMRRLLVTAIVAALGLSPGTSTACRRFGTQLECTLGSIRIFIGTQAEAEPSHERSLPIQSFHRGLGIGPHEPGRRHDNPGKLTEPIVIGRSPPAPRAPAEQIAERGRGTGRQRGGRFARKTEMPEDLAQHVGRLDRRGAFALRRGRPGRRASR